MKATLDASFCSPEKCPATLEIAPTDLQAGLSGEPALSLTPTAVDLPDVTLHDKVTVTLTLPSITLHGTDRFGGIVGGLLGSQANIFDALTSLFVGQGSLEEIAKIEMTDMTVAVSPFRASLGRIALHGIPEGEEVKASALKFDLDSLDFRALFRGLTAQLKGCLVMNGGDEACGKRETAYSERVTRPCVAPAVIRVHAAKEGQPIVVSGSHFGSSPGRLLVMNASSQMSTTIQSWTDTQIEVLPTPVIPRGAYFLQVQSAEGLLSTAVPFQID